MTSRWVLVLLLSGPALHAWQGTTPQAALEEIATATKPEIIARHLPEPVQKTIAVLPRQRRQQVMDQLLAIKADKLRGCTIRPAHNSEGWDIVDDQGNSKGKVKLANAFISGADALLPVEIDLPDGPQVFIVTMHLEEDEWRIDDFGPWEKTELGLAKLLHQPTEMEKNEAAVKATIQVMTTALREYAYSSPGYSFPSALSVLTVPIVPDNPDMAKEPLLDDSFAADPLIKDGYVFTYLLTNAGTGIPGTWGAYEITAVPNEYGKSGSRSYFANAYSVHSTTENRRATAEDPSED